MAKPGKSFEIRDLVISQIILGVILLITFILINPSKKLAAIKEQTRVKDINTIQTAINHYSQDHNGQLPKNFPKSGQSVEIKKNGGGVGDICSDLVPKYIPELPINPDLSIVPVNNCLSDYVTGYQISVKDGVLKVQSE